MGAMASRLLLAGLVGVAAIVQAVSTDGLIVLSESVPTTASTDIPESFVSYSIEFSSFPDFAGK
jgi:hypothetical protein